MKDTGTAAKITKFSKQFINNVRATRRSEINGKSIDAEQLTQPDTWDLITHFFKSDKEAYKKLLNMEYKKNA